jgi:hypothetical protein
MVAATNRDQAPGGAVVVSIVFGAGSALAGGMASLPESGCGERISPWSGV